MNANADPARPDGPSDATAPPGSATAPPGSAGGPRWLSEQGRALILPLGGMIAVVLLVGMSTVWPVDAQVITGAVTAVITLAATAGGYAAGAARRD